MVYDLRVGFEDEEHVGSGDCVSEQKNFVKFFFLFGKFFFSNGATIGVVVEMGLFEEFDHVGVRIVCHRNQLIPEAACGGGGGSGYDDDCL